MNDLSGQKALVTGGGTGVGAAIARTLADAGAEVWISGRRPEVLKAMADRHARLHAVTGDVTSPEDCARMIGAAGRPGIVVANAGAAVSKPFHRMSADDLRDMLEVNLLGVFNIWSAVLPALKETGSGRLITVASTAGLKGYAYVSAYSAAKHGVIGLTRSLALELATTGITVNAVCPGFTDTPMLDDTIANIMRQTGRDATDARKALTATNPQGRLVQPDEVADAVLWLSGPGAGSVTGQALSVSGGEVM
ncbi:SDR family NAD(P)-dependent oxidoreductase [uncultured Roseobacter sp.]|uniref:SDR family NAD(P)-dependent oxidoreductase n=1 Tax=uncultured Roseobacter sp. TaxID=114847 RepID=UPI0026154767|nr:SDR family NAD(P)-dependent oxidoreductase [uncultured Roseobacter sp.]